MSMDKKCSSCRKQFNKNNILNSTKNNIYLKKIEKTKKTFEKSPYSFSNNGYSYFICYNDYKHNTFNLVSCKHNINSLIVIDINIFDSNEKNLIIHKVNNHIKNLQQSNTNGNNLDKLWNNLNEKLHEFQYKYQYITGNDTYKKNIIKNFINNF